MNKDDIYSGITSDSDTWGMCCSEEMARKCAEDYYYESKKERKKAVISTIKGVLICIIIIEVLIFLNGLV